MAEKGTHRKRAARGFSLVLGILLAVLVVLYLGLRTDFFAHSFGRLVSRHFLAGTRFSISIDKLEGSIFRDVTIRGIKIHYRGPDVSFDVFRAEELTCKFDILSLMGKAGRIDEISLKKPVLRLKADPTGKFIVPSFGGGKGGVSTFEIRRFSIEEGHAIIQGAKRSDSVNDLNLAGSMRSGGSELELRLVQGSAEVGDSNFAVRSVKGRLVLRRETWPANAAAAPAARLVLDSLSIALEESAFTVNGMITPATRLFNLGVNAASIDVKEMARVLRVNTSHYGEFRGSFSMKGKPERFRLTGTVDGVISGYALDNFGVNLLREGSNVRLDSLSGFLNGAHVEGNGSYTLDAPNVLALKLNVRELDLSKGFVPKPQLPETRFNGKVVLTYRVQGEALAFSLDLGEGDFKGFPFDRAGVRGSYADGKLTLEDILLNHATHTVSARGTIAGDTLLFFFNVTSAARDVLFAYFNIEDYRADVNLNGMWKGTLTAWELRLSGSCRNLVYKNTFVREGDVKLAIRKNGAYDVYFDIDGPGCRIGPAEFSGLSLSLEYRDGVTNIKKLELSKKELRADITADIRVERNGAAVQFKEFSLEALGEKWVAAGACSIFIGDSVVRFDDIQFHSRAGAAFVDGSFDRKGRTLEGRFAFENLGLDLVNRAKLLSVPLEGKVRGAIRCSGSLSDPDLDVDLAMESGGIDTFAVDSMRLRAGYSKGRCRLDTLAIASPSGLVAMRGELSGMSLRSLRSDARAALKSAVVTIESSCENLKIAPLLGIARVRAISGGSLNGTLSMTDSLMHPLVSFKGRIDNLAVSAFRIPAIDCEVKLGPRELAAEGALHVSPSHAGSFRATVPLAPASFLYSLDRFRPVTFEVNLPEGDLAGLTGVTDLVAEAAGRYSGEIKVTGSIAEPHLFGNLHLKGASFRLSGMEEKYREVNAVVVLEDTLVTIARLSGKEGKEGTFSGSGWIALKGWKPARYNLAANVNDFVLASLSNVIAIVSGTLNVTTRVEDGRALPVLSGSCTVKESELYYDLGSLSTSPQTGTVELPSWIAAIDLKVPGNTWIRTPDARVELQGNVTLYHDNKGTYLRGELALLRGWYNVYNNKFSITSGTLQFVYAGSSRPVVDIEAETRDPEGRRIYLTLQWHQDDLEPRLTLRHEDAGYSETDIWKMLGGGVVGTADKPGTSWDARNTAQNLAANFVERYLNSQMQGLTIELESGTGINPVPGLSDYKETKIAVGKYLSQGLYVKYKQGLSISSARQIEVEYRISDLFLLRSEVIRYSEKVLQGKSPRSSDEITVDVKLHWEF